MAELTPEPKTSEAVVPEGVRQARAAFLRDFDALFADPKVRGRFVVYHKDRRVAVAKKFRAACDEAYRLNLPDGEHLVIEVSLGSAEYERVVAVEGDLDSI